MVAFAHMRWLQEIFVPPGFFDEMAPRAAELANGTWILVSGPPSRIQSRFLTGEEIALILRHRESSEWVLFHAHVSATIALAREWEACTLPRYICPQLALLRSFVAIATVQGPAVYLVARYRFAVQVGGLDEVEIVQIRQCGPE